MKKQILIVEDDPFKKEKIISYINELIPFVSIHDASSFSSGWIEIQSNEFDLIILDMTLPTYNRTEIEKGGVTRTYGGRELARKIKRRKIVSPIIFITQYQAFSSDNGRKSISELNETLKKDLNNSTENIIYFNSSSSEWKKSIKRVLKQVYTKI